MSKSPKELKEELERIRKEEVMAKQKREAEELKASRESSRAAAEDKVKKGRYTKDPQTREQITLYEDAIRRAEGVLNADVMAYTDARAAIMGLLKMYSALVKALSQSMKEIRHSAGEKFIVTPFFWIKDKIASKLTGNPEIDLPELMHEVSYTDDNKLKIEPLTRSDNGNEKGKLDAIYEKLIYMWLEENGYTPDKNEPGKFVDANGAHLDKATFEQLKNDPSHGLNYFLSEQEPDVQFRPR
ncbi:hydrolase [Legionella norrlandica]|uniref:Hydrolase n=1 Tax=Legionella norrlandica TaxID=1498499 RepID=A0A0A2SPR7_9GAMM|nr:hypothetical protein [Legionella norrlandica]KGP62747.1 hydrolase [Legionella norrlandica]